MTRLSLAACGTIATWVAGGRDSGWELVLIGKIEACKSGESLTQNDARTVLESLRSDNGATRQLELSTFFRRPGQRVRGEAQRREGFLSGKTVS